MGNGDDGDVDSEFRRRFWDIACEYDDYLKAALAITLLLLSLLLLATPGITRGTGSFVVLIIDLVLLGSLLAVTLYLVWRCRRRKPERRF